MRTKRILIFLTLILVFAFTQNQADTLKTVEPILTTKKPNGKRIAGIALTANGIVGLSFGIPFLIHGSQKGNDLGEGLEYAMSFVLGLIGIVEGTATLIPGCILLANSYSNPVTIKDYSCTDKSVTLYNNNQIFKITINF